MSTTQPLTNSTPHSHTYNYFFRAKHTKIKGIYEQDIYIPVPHKTTMHFSATDHSSEQTKMTKRRLTLSISEHHCPYDLHRGEEE